MKFRVTSYIQKSVCRLVEADSPKQAELLADTDEGELLWEKFHSVETNLVEPVTEEKK